VEASASVGHAEHDTADRCPVRKLTSPDDPALPAPALEHVTTGPEPRWVVRSFELARHVLRSAESTHQAGFGAERVDQAGPQIRPAILYLEGTEHHTQRRATARFFSPKVVEDYREMMQMLSDRLVARVRTDRWVDLSGLSLHMAVRVAANVVGLTNSSASRMGRRLSTFFEGDPTEKVHDVGSFLRTLRRHTVLLRFFLLDVKPAIRARRRSRQDDVISQLLDAGYNDLDILTECVTYGAAGMVTTREFITVAVWHLLDEPTLLARYRRAGRDERLAILDETLRLEPVVGHLFRRTTAPLTLDGPEGPVELPAGTLIDLDIRTANADGNAAGADPVSLCPHRELARSVPPTMLSFGDGHHRCPGGPLALMETEVFVSTLLRRDVVAEGPPRVRWNQVSQGYDLDRFRIRLRR
jgi:cytochrome P450